MRQPNPCENMNHRRSNAPIAHCPACGYVVNDAISGRACTEADHAAERRRQNAFCTGCGAELIANLA